MISFNGHRCYSQFGQDLLALKLLGKDGVFIDIGAADPKSLNNSFLLEENGWTGVAIEIVDRKEDWEVRKTPFFKLDALVADYNKLFRDLSFPSVIDFLSLDVEGNGDRYKTLLKVFNSGHEFKVIAVEHDAYRGYEQTEKIPQEKFLKERGYVQLYDNDPVEGWWINPKYVDYSSFSLRNEESCEWVNEEGRVYHQRMTHNMGVLLKLL